MSNTPEVPVQSVIDRYVRELAQMSQRALVAEATVEALNNTITELINNQEKPEEEK